MPYIENRGEFDSRICDADPQTMGRLCRNPGELNFLITSIVHGYIIGMGLNYGNINEAIGALECAKLEVYRQVVAKYEDKKKRENGAISELDARTLEDVR